VALCELGSEGEETFEHHVMQQTEYLLCELRVEDGETVGHRAYSTAKRSRCSNQLHAINAYFTLGIV
jgi:hypothetical protein